MKTRSLLPAVCVVAALCLACRGETSVPHAQPTAPETIVLISIDALRADHLGCYGYPRDTSPVIDRLADQGAVLENAITQASWTLPSFLSLFTSRYPLALPSEEDQAPVPETIPMLTEYLAEAGYATAGFVSSPYLAAEYGFARGFDCYEVVDRQSTTRIVSRALSWLRRVESERRFLFIHTLDVHGPYRPPAPFNTMFVNAQDLLEPEPGHGTPVSDRNHVFGMIPRYQYLPGHRNLGYYLSQYDGAIRNVDAQLAELFTALAQEQLWDDALIIVTADHGESLGEHQYLLDHGIVTEPVMRVPLIIKLPRQDMVTGRVAGQVQLIDLLPTLLHALGIEPRARVSGRSLYPVLRGEAESTAEYAFCSSGIMDQWAVRTASWKYVRGFPGTAADHTWQSCPYRDPHDRDAAVEQLFHLPSDPAELVNLADSEPRQVAAMAAVLDRWLEEQRALKTAPMGVVLDAVDETTREQLDALGYDD